MLVCLHPYENREKHHRNIKLVVSLLLKIFTDKWFVKFIWGGGKDPHLVVMNVTWTLGPNKRDSTFTVCKLLNWLMGVQPNAYVCREQRAQHWLLVWTKRVMKSSAAVSDSFKMSMCMVFCRCTILNHRLWFAMCKLRHYRDRGVGRGTCKNLFIAQKGSRTDITGEQVYLRNVWASPFQCT